MEQFKKYNANPKNKKASDCVIRALTVGLGKEYFDIVDDLVKVYKKTGYIINEPKCYTKYLEQLGYEKQKQPRKFDNTKYTVKDFINKLAKPNTTYILNLAHHLAVVKNSCLIDTWDCSGKTVGNYWEID